MLRFDTELTPINTIDKKVLQFYNNPNTNPQIISKALKTEDKRVKDMGVVKKAKRLKLFTATLIESVICNDTDEVRKCEEAIKESLYTSKDIQDFLTSNLSSSQIHLTFN